MDTECTAYRNRKVTQATICEHSISTFRFPGKRLCGCYIRCLFAKEITNDKEKDKPKEVNHSDSGGN